MADSGRLNGVFLGFANQVRASTRLRMVVDADGARWVVERLGEAGTWTTVAAMSPDVCLHDAELAAAIEVIGGDGQPVAIVKEAPKPVPCPECFGIEPLRAHCDRCLGAGVVPG